MKKLMLVASLCIAAVVAAPVASASAAENLACSFAGPATFPAPGLGLVPKETTYKFTSTAGECTVVETGEKLKVESASVQGEGALACTVSEGEAGLLAKKVKGSGTIKIEKREEFTFTFRFNASGVLVVFKIQNGKSAGGKTLEGSGTANFVKNATALTECPKEEVKTLNFEAQALAEVKP